HTRSRGAAEEERRKHDRASGARVLAAHRGEAEVEEELAGARMLQERAVDREQDDQRRRYLDRGAENAFERLVKEARHARYVVAAVRPLTRQPRTRESVGEKGDDDAADDPARRAAAGFEHEQHESDAEEDIEPSGNDIAVPEVVASREQVDDGRHAQERA